jgi:hypothetical protein
MILNKLLEDCRRCGVYTILMDETTDSATKEQSSVCIRYINDDLEVIEFFLCFHEVTSTTAVALEESVLAVLSKYNLLLYYLRGQG